MKDIYTISIERNGKRIQQFDTDSCFIVGNNMDLNCHCKMIMASCDLAMLLNTYEEIQQNLKEFEKQIINNNPIAKMLLDTVKETINRR